MKQLKSIFGRMSIVGLAILAQVVIMFLFFSYLNNYYFILRVVSAFLCVLVILTVVNRDMTTEAKIPWLIVVCLMPLFGTLIYFLFSGNQSSRKQKRVLREVEVEAKSAALQLSARTARFPDTGAKYRGQASYIYRCTGQDAYAKTATTFFESGETFFADLLTELETAKHFIFMEYFIIEEGVMWNSILEILCRKAKMGVEVRFVYDDIGSIGKVGKYYYHHLRALGIQCVKFNPFRPVLTAVHNNRDHRKIAVIDGRVGYTGGMNLADEYINKTHPFGYWKDSAVKLCGPGVDGLTLMFLEAYDSQSMQIDNYMNYLGKAEPIDLAGGIVVPYADGPRPVYHEYIAENVYLNMIGQAERYLWITTPYLIPDHRLMDALCIAAKRGVDVRIVTPHVPDKKLVWHITRSHYRKLQEAGVKIFEFEPGFLHAKQFLCDGECAIVGTINLDYRSLVHHFECGVWLWRADCIDDIYADFEKLFRYSVSMENFRQALPMALLCRIGAAFFPLL